MLTLDDLKPGEGVRITLPKHPRLGELEYASRTEDLCTLYLVREGVAQRDNYLNFFADTPICLASGALDAYLEELEACRAKAVQEIHDYLMEQVNKKVSFFEAHLTRRIEQEREGAVMSHPFLQYLEIDARKKARSLFLQLSIVKSQMREARNPRFGPEERLVDEFPPEDHMGWLQREFGWPDDHGA